MKRIPKKNLFALYRQSLVLLAHFESIKVTRNIYIEPEWGIIVSKNFLDTFEWLLNDEEDEEEGLKSEKDHDAS